MRALHPLAWLLSLALLMSGVAMDALLDRSRGRRPAPRLRGAARGRPSRAWRGSASPPRLILILAHVATGRQGLPHAIAPAAVIAWRLLALLYLLRWPRASRSAHARWLMVAKAPARPRVLLLLVESARLTAGLLPVAVARAEQHVTAAPGP